MVCSLKICNFKKIAESFLGKIAIAKKALLFCLFYVYFDLLIPILKSV